MGGIFKRCCLIMDSFTTRVKHTYANALYWEWYEVVQVVGLLICVKQGREEFRDRPTEIEGSRHRQQKWHVDDVTSCP
eukprot:15340532-Ditylum_brightwellii.AAC.1